jgi:hypothetical protein
LNQLIHKTDFEVFTSRAILSHRLHRSAGSDYSFMKDLQRPSDAIEPLYFVREDNGLARFRLMDVVESSTVVAEKVIEVCSDAQVYLELDMRNM